MVKEQGLYQKSACQPIFCFLHLFFLIPEIRAALPFTEGKWELTG